MCPRLGQASTSLAGTKKYGNDCPTDGEGDARAAAAGTAGHPMSTETCLSCSSSRTPNPGPGVWSTPPEARRKRALPNSLAAGAALPVRAAPAWEPRPGTAPRTSTAPALRAQRGRAGDASAPHPAGQGSRPFPVSSCDDAPPRLHRAVTPLHQVDWRSRPFRWHLVRSRPKYIYKFLGNNRSYKFFHISS